MSYLYIYFNDELRSKHKLNAMITRIGRNQDNDIVIDNPGVSGAHAEIIKSGDNYTIYDLDSKNGVFVNGERVNSKALKYSDEIRIFKHKLRLLAVDLPMAADPIETKAQQQAGDSASSATVEVDVSKLDSLLKQKLEQTAFLIVTNGALAGRRIQLTASRFSFGKSPDNDFQVGGWFAPQVAAKIVRQSDGYYLAPEKRGKVRLNGRSVTIRTKITNGSAIEIRGTSFNFRY